MNAYKTDDISIIENIAGALSRSVLSTFLLWAILFFSIGCEGVNSLNRINSNNVSDSDSGESFDTSGFEDEIVLDDTVIPLEVSSLSLTGVSLLFESSKFLYTGDDPVQKGVTEEIISPVKVAVLRGKVRDRRGRALAGVRVTIRGNSVFGYTLSRADGMFDMVVNGGSRLTVDYQKDGFISLQRSLVPVMQDYNIVEDVMMTELSSKSTVINFENSSLSQTATGEVVSDRDGRRQAAVIFPSGVKAHAITADGSETQLSSGTLRITEFTYGPYGPSAMPGILPATSGYTYAVSLLFDEAEAINASGVVFDKPVPFYVDNFLKFPTGITVPAGYYDRNKGRWLPSTSGRVVEILSIENGAAVVDLNGNGEAATEEELLALGFERRELEELAKQYSAGQSLWRVALAHFSSWDCNWPFRPPEGAEAPGEWIIPDMSLDEVCTQNGSVIYCESQVLGESFNITGTPYSLVYTSSKAQGNMEDYKITVPLSGNSLPEKSKRIELEIYIAGRRFVESFEPAPNLSYAFVWDGKDVYGRELNGRYRAKIRAGYVYDGIYEETERFASPGNAVITGSLTREEVTLWRESEVLLGALKNFGKVSGGMSFDVHHTYDPLNQTIYLGDGTVRKAGSFSETIKTVGKFEGIPNKLAFGIDGSLYISLVGLNGARVYRMEPDGKLSIFAGMEGQDWSGDGGPAVEAVLDTVSGLAVSKDGSVYIADEFSDRVRKVSPDGIIRTVAGGGAEEITTTPVLGTLAKLQSCRDLATDDVGGVYILEHVGSKVYYLDAEEKISLVAGGGKKVPNEFGVLPLEADLSNLSALRIAPDGNLYLVSFDYGKTKDTDLYSSLIYKLDDSGLIRKIGGGGLKDQTDTEGIYAQNAYLDRLQSVDIGPDGTVYFAEFEGRLKKISPDGKVYTAAGCGDSSSCGEEYFDYKDDGYPSKLSYLGLVESLALGQDGLVYFTNLTESRVRRVQSAFPSVSKDNLLIASKDGAELYLFDREGRHLETTDAVTGAKPRSFEYDENQMLKAIIENDKLKTVVERGQDGSLSAVISPFGLRTELEANEDMYISAVTDPAGRKHEMKYNKGGLLTSLKKPNGGIYTFEYNDEGKLTADADPVEAAAGKKKQLLKEGAGVSFTSAEGRKTSYSTSKTKAETIRSVIFPDGLENLQVKNRHGRTVLNTKDGTVYKTETGGDPRWGYQAPLVRKATTETPSGLTKTVAVERTVLPDEPEKLLDIESFDEKIRINSKIYQRSYDTEKKLWTIQTPEGRRTYASLDDKYRIAEIIEDSLYPTRYAYLEDNRLESISTGEGEDTRVYTFSYDPNGYLKEITDPLGKVTSYVRDRAGQVISKSFPDGREISITYDNNGNVTAITPPSRPEHEFFYTPVDLTETYKPPTLTDIANTSTNYSYNLDRQITQIKRPDGKTIDYLYNSAGKLSGINLSNKETINFAYNSNTGKLETLTSPDGEIITYTYDGFLPTEMSMKGPITGTISQSYDNNFRVISRAVNKENEVSFTYDNDGLLKSAGDLNILLNPSTGLPDGTTLGQITTSNTYTTFGELQSETYTASGTPIYQVIYERDALGRIVERTETIEGTSTAYTYTYDLSGRLIEVYQNGDADPTSRYDYDTNGNRISFSDYRSGTMTVNNGEYDNQDRMTSYGNATKGYAQYEYTANGELLTKTLNEETTTYNYDVLGNLRAVTLPDGTEINYIIDGQNRRVGKKVNGTIEQGLLYKDELNPIAELDGTGQVVSTFVYGSKFNVPDYIKSNKADKETWVTYRIISDHLGSPRLVVNAATGEIVQRMDFDELGRVMKDTNPGFQPFGFAGGIYDGDTGLVRFGARDYDAETGRWTSKDPIGFGGGDTSLYGYVFADPVNWIDPIGLDTWGIGLVGSGGAGGGGAGYIGSALDSQGNIGAFQGGGGGGYGGVSYSSGVFLQWTNADNLHQMEGWSFQHGLSFGLGYYIGVELIQAKDYWGFNILLGYGAGFEIHSFAEWLKFNTMGNLFEFVDELCGD